MCTRCKRFNIKKIYEREREKLIRYSMINILYVFLSKSIFKSLKILKITLKKNILYKKKVTNIYITLIKIH